VRGERNCVDHRADLAFAQMIFADEIERPTKKAGMRGSVTAAAPQ
jgi:hypothetical protein